MDAYLNDPSIGVVEKANDMGYKLLINYERCPDFLELALRQGCTPPSTGRAWWTACSAARARWAARATSPGQPVL
ncbi:hypothetical protein M5E87_14920 [Flavonifractor plautii]|nr:hypothetical protein M5E87_14920 [Flavonifractor plautii]